MHWFLAALKKYAVFSGRAQRAEFWYFILFYFILALIAALIDRALGWENPDGGGMLASILGLALLLPSLAVCARRLHDTGRTGWWQLIWLLPLIGAIVLIIFTVKDSEPGPNRFGPNPKGVGA